MLRLLDNDKPARFPTSVVWKNCDFETLDELIDYANDWLGKHSPGKIELGEHLRNNNSFSYGGYGDYISIERL